MVWSKHREIDWASRSSQAEEFEVVIMIAVATEEMHGSDRVPDLKTITSEPWLDKAKHQLERNGALL